jgi:hypothetical protein
MGVIGIGDNDMNTYAAALAEYARRPCLVTSRAALTEIAKAYYDGLLTHKEACQIAAAHSWH